MCAIIFTNDPKISEKDFLNSLDKMNHRGPDNTGYYSTKISNLDTKIVYSRPKCSFKSAFIQKR